MRDYGIDLRGNMTVGADNTHDVGDVSHRLKIVHAVTFEGTATSALYADIAEMYTVDGSPQSGDVIAFDVDGDFDGILCIEEESENILGVVSTNPGFILDKNLPGGKLIALKGKVPCKIVGPVKKGDRIVSAGNGCAKSATSDKGATIGKSLFTNLSGGVKIGLIKV